MKSLPSFRALRSALCASASIVFALSASGEVTWNLVTNASDLAVGDVVIIAANGADVGMAPYVSGNNCKTAPITKSGNTCTPESGVGEFTLETGSESGSFAFKNGIKYLNASGGTSNNYLKDSTSISSTSSWTISIANGVATIKATFSNASNARNWMRYNSGSTLFSCYSSGQQDICLYRKTGDGGDDPPPSPDAPSISVSPTSLSVAVGGTAQTTITTNNAVSVTASVGLISGNTWSWTPTSTGTTTVTFTATGAAGTTPATATLTVNVTAASAGLSAPSIADASNLLSNGTGFTANWSSVSGASGYEIQIATNNQFDAVANILVSEDFSTLTDSSYPDGWSGSKTSGLGPYTSDTFAGEAKPAFKFQAANQTLVSPTFSGGASVSFYAKPNTKPGSTFTVAETLPSGASTTYPAITINEGKTYTQALSGNATKVTFKMETREANVIFDDVLILGTTINSVVASPSVSGASTTSKAITGLTPHTMYYIRVRAVNGSLHSDWSGSVSVMTEAGNTNYAPEITSFSPTTATVSLNATQSFSLGYTDDNHNDTLTLAVADNGTPLTNAMLSGVSGTFSYTYTATAPGFHALAFTLSDGTASVSTNATVTVPIPVPSLGNIDSASLLDNGTGFSVSWSAVPIATGYELQIATNALFDVGRNIVAEEHFDDLTNGIPQGWNSSKGSGYYYNAAANHYGISQPSYKFDTDNQTLTTPVVSSPVWAVGFNTYGQSGGVSTLTVVGLQNGSSASQVAIQPAETTMVEQLVELTAAADQVRFSFTKVKNLSLDDVVLYGPVHNAVVQTHDDLASSATSMDVEDLAPNTTYYVRIRTLYNGAVSDWSTAVSATTPTGGENFPPVLSVTPAATNVMGGAFASFTVTYSDPNANDSLTLAVAIDGAAATPLDLASGASYTYTPAVAGAHRLIFSVSDGTLTAYFTNNVSVALAAPAIGDVTNPTSAPYGFTAHWGAVSLAEGYEVEVATDPLFDEALGDIVFTEDFYTLSETEPPTAWTASAVNGLRFTSAGKCGARIPAFRFGTSGDTLESPEFSPGSYLEFFAYSSKGPQTLYAVGNTAGGEETRMFTIAEGRGNYSTNFSSAVTSIRFDFSQQTAGGYVGLDDILVRSSATKDSRIKAIAAPGGSTTSLALTSLEGAITYYVRVRATSGTIASDWSESAVVPYLAAPENVAFHHGKYIESGASLTWDAAIGADSYRIKVLEADIVTPTEILSEDFYQGATAPAGWKFTGTIETSGDGYCGESAPALKLKNGASVTTPTLEYPAKSVSLIASATGDSGGSLSLSALVDGDWQVVGTLSPANKTPTPFSFQLPEGTTKVKVAFNNYVSGTNFAIDDFVVWGTGPIWHDYDTFTTTLTTLPLPDLHHDSPYEFIVSAVNEFGEIAADPVKDTAPPNNPGTILKFQ